MSRNANTMLIAVLTHHTKIITEHLYEKILNHLNTNEQLDVDIKGHRYVCRLMRTNFDDCYQIELPKSTVYLMSFVTYGYGTKISWTTLENQKENLEVFVKELSEKFNCSYEIFISANYF